MDFDGVEELVSSDFKWIGSSTVEYDFDARAQPQG